MEHTTEKLFLKKVNYRDLWVRLALSLIAAHWVVSFGEPETIFELWLMWDYWRSLVGSWFLAFGLVSLVRWICLKLDKRLDWQEHPVTRPLVQVTTGIGVMCMVAYAGAAVYFAAHGLDVRNTEYISLDWPLIIAMLFIINLYYLIYYVVVVWRQIGKQTQEQSVRYRQVFIVHVAANNIPINTNNIAYFLRQNDENFLRTKDGKDYLMTDALDHIEGMLDPNDFFRGNRQFIVSFEACDWFEVIENDKLELFVKPSFRERIIISQKRAPAFRKWMGR